MKKCLIAFAALSLLFACTPDNNNGNGNGNGNNGNNNNNGGDQQELQDEPPITGEVTEVTDYSVTLFNYAYLPLSAATAEVGVVYGKLSSFEDGKKAVSQLQSDYTFTVTITDLEPSTYYYYKAYVKKGTEMEYGVVRSFTTKEYQCPEGAVDLGIIITPKDGTPYKLYWAQANLCESGICANPEDYGDFYAWGEITPKSNYDWSTYKFGSPDPGPISKYNTLDIPVEVDNLTVLEPEDDAAHDKLDGKWRMPTFEEWTTLTEECTWVWTEDYSGTGVKGSLVIGPNGKDIFLPAAGFMDGTEHLSEGIYGLYWSSTLEKDHPEMALYLSIDEFGASRYPRERCTGFSVRPVTE